MVILVNFVDSVFCLFVCLLGGLFVWFVFFGGGSFCHLAGWLTV